MCRQFDSSQHHSNPLIFSGFFVFRATFWDSIMKILIDNGHGRETPGKRSPDGTLREYAWNRLIAGQIVNRLVTQGHDAQLLVPEEEDISLKERCRRVNTICRQFGKKKWDDV